MNPDFTDLAIPYGRQADGIMVGAAEPGLRNGLACGCRCPICDVRLVARNMGEVRQPYFAHEAVDGSDDHKIPCGGAKETSIHLMAKQIFADNFVVKLPDLIARLSPGRFRSLHGSEHELWHRLSNVRLEKWCEGFRPDIIASYAGHSRDGLSRQFAEIGSDVTIEIVVTNPCTQDKIDKLRQKGLAAFDINLSRERYHATDSSLRNAINKAPRGWLYHPMVDSALVEMIKHPVYTDYQRVDPSYAVPVVDPQDLGEPYVVDDKERAARGAEKWRQVVRNVQSRAIADGSAVYVSSPAPPDAARSYSEKDDV